MAEGCLDFYAEELKAARSMFCSNTHIVCWIDGHQHARADLLRRLSASRSILSSISVGRVGKSRQTAANVGKDSNAKWLRLREMSAKPLQTLDFAKSHSGIPLSICGCLPALPGPWPWLTDVSAGELARE